MPLGSSSAAPVIRPGPSRAHSDCFLAEAVVRLLTATRFISENTEPIEMASRVSVLPKNTRTQASGDYLLGSYWKEYATRVNTIGAFLEKKGRKRKGRRRILFLIKISVSKISRPQEIFNVPLKGAVKRTP